MIKTCLYIFSISILSSACSKILDNKPSKSLSTPSTIEDLQLLLDAYSKMNAQSYPNASEILSDDYYLRSADWSSLVDESQRNLYVWKKDLNLDNQWNATGGGPYSAILQANIVLDELAKIQPEPQAISRWENVKGSALFFRAFYFFGLSQLFSKPYVESTASTDLGIPLRLSSDLNEISVRRNLQITYNQILTDIKDAANLLPDMALIKSRPSKSAAFGALAKIYLTMQKYDSAFKYSDLCIKIYGKDSLINFNQVSYDFNGPTANAPFRRWNREVIFQMRTLTSTILANSRAKIDSNLLALFLPGDLRKQAYFRENTGDNSGTYAFKGDYDGSGTNSGYVFAGIVLDEMYLIRSESFARMGMVEQAMADLNTLIATRWESNEFVPYAAPNSIEAIKIILQERRKELIRRGVRWSDLRRLKEESEFNIIPRRLIDNVEYKLEPTSLRYTLLIPQVVINLSGIQQND